MTITLTLTWWGLIKWLLILLGVVYVVGIVLIVIYDRRSRDGWINFRIGLWGALLWPVLLYQMRRL